MGCQAMVVLGDNLTFTITTHRADTAVLTDADGLPTYRIYEDETAAPILNGTMALLNPANTTGFYSELIACTAANGFEDGRSYNIYIEATVNGITGGISYGFVCQIATWSTLVRTLTMSAVAVISAVDGDDIAILRGDTFSATITGLGDLSVQTGLWFSVKVQRSDADGASIIQISEDAGLLFLNGAAAGVAANGSIVINDPVTGSITITLEAAETDDLRPQALHYDIQMATATAVTTLSEGSARVVADVTRVIA